mmetsp:Transcript_2195/g.9505  ORF Transcript_2195/g.9505 Transcript_2195/m.9505 type:complete len:224 (-) Transcript_2195:921-1592(-)
MRFVSSMASLSLAFPIFERCDRPRASVFNALRSYPGRFLQGPLLNCGFAGFMDGRESGTRWSSALRFSAARRTFSSSISTRSAVMTLYTSCSPRISSSVALGMSSSTMMMDRAVVPGSLRPSENDAMFTPALDSFSETERSTPGRSVLLKMRTCPEGTTSTSKSSISVMRMSPFAKTVPVMRRTPLRIPSISSSTVSSLDTRVDEGSACVSTAVYRPISSARL